MSVAESAVTGVVSVNINFIFISLEFNYPIASSQVVNGVLGFNTKFYYNYPLNL